MNSKPFVCLFDMQFMFLFYSDFSQFLKSSQQSPTTSESEHEQLESFEEERLKLLKAWRTFLIVCSSFQVGLIMRVRNIKADI